MKSTKDISVNKVGTFRRKMGLFAEIGTIDGVVYGSTVRIVASDIVCGIINLPMK